MELILNLESPYTETGQPRKDLPTGEVLVWDGKEWCNGFLERIAHKVILVDTTEKELIALANVRRFAVLPTIIEEDGN